MELAEPLLLNRALTVAYDDGNTQHWILCGACDLKTIENPNAKMDAPTDCLHVLGAVVKSRFDVPPRLIPFEIVIPCQFVTYIGLGPKLQITRPSDRHVGWVMPTAPGPLRGPMPLEKIEATLNELRDAV